MSETEQKVLPLKGSVQTYEWGKLGLSSKVAQLVYNDNLCRGEEESSKVYINKPFAELWLGTHPKGPSSITMTQMPLADWLKKHEDSFGSKLPKKFPEACGSGQLPFLLKVLSVNKALSIQAHPEKKHAEELHKKKPTDYPDENHKPEMAIALSDFEALCGFRPKKEIVGFMKGIPELGAIIGEENIEELDKAKEKDKKGGAQAALKKCFTTLMTSDPAVMAKQLAALVKRTEQRGDLGENTEDVLGDLLLRLYVDFPGDVGCFGIYFFNRILLKPGEAIFLEANLPHAYLQGDCIECMACSDNVVRAGLTPKFKDVETLCEMLNYEGKKAEANKFAATPSPKDTHCLVYDPPVPDFTVAKIQLPGEMRDDYHLTPVDSASILLMVEGKAVASTPTLRDDVLRLHTGSSLFIAANEKVQLTVKSADGVLAFRAYCNL